MALTAVALAAALFLLTRAGYIRPNRPDEARYPVRGVDVSAWQGQIDWQQLQEQGVDFAFIKATEGAAAQDRCYRDHVQEAMRNGVRVGSYHFFSFDSDGFQQAENFIRTAQYVRGMLPPVVDVELYGAYRDQPPDGESLRRELDVLLGRLEAVYGVRPIIYTSMRMYYRYFMGMYEDYPLWISSIYCPPLLPFGARCVFWQYTDRGELRGYDGQQYIDLDVFCGTEEEFAAFGW